MGSGSTKEWVVLAAVRLFNESGTTAGISPGNLYYHFRNKEEIIRETWARVDGLWERSYALPSDGPLGLDDLGAMVEATFSGLWEYRFFYREFGALTRRDPELRRRGLAGTEALLRSFIGSGVLRGLEGPGES